MDELLELIQQEAVVAQTLADLDAEHRECSRELERLRTQQAEARAERERIMAKQYEVQDDLRRLAGSPLTYEYNIEHEKNAKGTIQWLPADSHSRVRCVTLDGLDYDFGFIDNIDPTPRPHKDPLDINDR